MDRSTVVVVVVAALIFVAFLAVQLPDIRAKLAEQREGAEQRAETKAAADECLALEARIVQGRLQGADLTQAAQAEAAFRQCLERTRVDEVFRAPLVIARAMSEQARQEWTHYRSTSGDPAKRNSTRNTINRVAGDFMQQIRDAVALARTKAQIDAIEAVARAWEGDARERVLCLLTNGAGCADQGFERGGNERANDDYDRQVTPLVGSAVAVAELKGWGLNPSFAVTSGAGIYAAIAAKRAELRAGFVVAAARATPVLSGVRFTLL